MFSNQTSSTLVSIINGDVDLIEEAKQELKNRGLDSAGQPLPSSDRLKKHVADNLQNAKHESQTHSTPYKGLRSDRIR